MQLLYLVVQVDVVVVVVIDGLKHELIIIVGKIILEVHVLLDIDLELLLVQLIDEVLYINKKETYI